MNFEGILVKGKVPSLIAKSRETYMTHDLEGILDLYVHTNNLINKSFKEKDDQNILFYILSNLSLIEPYIEYRVKIDGEFRPVPIPAIETGLIFFPIHKYLAQVKLIEDIVDTFDELKYYKKDVAKSYTRLKITEYIHSKGNVELPISLLQQELKVDKQLILETCNYLEQFSLIRQIRREGLMLIVKIQPDNIHSTIR